MQERLRLFLFNINVFNRGLPRVLPELLSEAGGADMLLLNEVTSGSMRRLLAATHDLWSTVDGPSSLFVGLVPFRMSIHLREGTGWGGLERLASVSVGRSVLGGRRALVA